MAWDEKKDRALRSIAANREEVYSTGPTHKAPLQGRRTKGGGGQKRANGHSGEPPVWGGHTLAMPAWNEVHIWLARLDVPLKESNRLQATLSEDERGRARGFPHESGRCRYVAGRGILRRLLAGYFGLPPEEMAFTYGPHGKPQLAPSLAGSGLRLNFSHSGGWALYAIAHCREVGIDLESKQSGRAWPHLAPVVFSARERAELSGLPAAQKRETFFRGWTRKAAYVKGRGNGLSPPLDSFDVPLAPRHAPWPVNATSGCRWWLHSINPIAGYVGALAVEGGPVRLLFRYLTPRLWQAEDTAAEHSESPAHWERMPAIEAREGRPLRISPY